jgi:hypothetical protein
MKFAGTIWAEAKAADKARQKISVNLFMVGFQSIQILNP